MVTFVCDECQATLKKAKVLSHRCNSNAFSCVDCNKVFSFEETKAHTSCVSEAEKYEKSLYKGKRKNDDATAAAEANAIKKAKKEEAVKQEQVKLSIENLSEKIVNTLSSKPMTLRKLKKKLVKEDSATDDQILQAIFAVARKITLSANQDEDDD